MNIQTSVVLPVTPYLEADPTGGEWMEHGLTLMRMLQRTRTPESISFRLQPNPTRSMLVASCSAQDLVGCQALAELNMNPPAHWDRIAWYELTWHAQRTQLLEMGRELPPVVRAQIADPQLIPQVPETLATASLQEILETMPLPMKLLIEHRNRATSPASNEQIAARC